MRLSQVSDGSSPRVWGQVLYSIFCYMVFGIIPTRVGTSTAKDLFNASSRDHPHACGDKKTSVYLSRQQEGSSPRVWGQDICRHTITENFRIIPTRVGTSGELYLNDKDCGDHPHACGDKPLAFCAFCALSGSSPRVWGQVDINGNRPEIFRIIPTRVGTSIISCILVFNARDHPHACGDKYLTKSVNCP